jgi:hypothetical protein
MGGLAAFNLAETIETMARPVSDGYAARFRSLSK